MKCTLNVWASDYQEPDPTIFVALTYSFIFGVMFEMRALLLAIGGFALYKWKQVTLGAIIGTAGIFSTFFGFMFGSIFGFEHTINALWLRPVEAMMLVPGLGQMNTIFVVAIVFGMFLILVTMIFHIIKMRYVLMTQKVSGLTRTLSADLFFMESLTASLLFLFPHRKINACHYFNYNVCSSTCSYHMLKESITRIGEENSCN